MEVIKGMKMKTIIFGSLLAVFLMLMIPNVSAVEYTIHKSNRQNEKIFSIMPSLLKTTNFPEKVWEIINIILAILLGGSIGILFSKLYFSKTVYVDDDASEDWYDFYHVKTIQEGIDHANKGYANNVRIYSGTYDGQIMMSSSPLSPGNMGHWLIGNGSSSTIINAEGCDFGINLSKIDGWSRIIGVTIKNANGPGIDLGNSQWNFIYENTLCNNTIGIKNEGGNYCPIWKNNFISNEINAYDTGNNEWSFSWESYHCDGNAEKTGNYWDNYNGIDEDQDGVGDTPYQIIGGNSIDNYPFMHPWEE